MQMRPECLAIVWMGAVAMIEPALAQPPGAIPAA
jgi:hypothetical protein